MLTDLQIASDTLIGTWVNMRQAMQPRAFNNRSIQLIAPLLLPLLLLQSAAESRRGCQIECCAVLIVGAANPAD